MWGNTDCVQQRGKVESIDLFAGVVALSVLSCCRFENCLRLSEIFYDGCLR